jgi:hypothetical protein
MSDVGSVQMPTLHLGRCPDGTFMGRCTERSGVAPEATWVFVGGTPAEIVQQWEDRYADRPHTLKLTDEERDTLRRMVGMEVRVDAHTTASPRRLNILRALAERLE